MFDDAIVFRNKLIMVMGLQRSGTSALTDAIGQDPALQVETESPNNRFYDNYFLRPEPEIRGLLWSIKRRVLLKPISEIQRRTVEDVLREYESYGTKLVWTYRDPVNVWSSMGVSLNVPDADFDKWARLWVQGNQFILDALQGPFASQIVVVRYEDLISQRNMFTALCDFLGVEERNNLFWQADEKKGRRRLESALQERIEELAGPTLAELNRHRLQSRIVGVRVGAPEADARYELSKSAWALVKHGTSSGTLEIPGHCPTRMRIKVQNAEGNPPESVQVIQLPIEVRTNKTYTFAVWARAEEPRTIGCYLGRAKEPWTQLSEYYLLELSPQWQLYHRDFTVSADEPAARFCFDAAGHEADVEISEPLLTAGIREIGLLHVHNEAKAKISYDPELVDTCRIEIENGGTEDSDVQLQHSLVNFEKGDRYLITFLARADATREICVAASQATEPWQGMGLYERLTLTPVWRSFELELEATLSGPGRFHFDLGNSAVPVELAKIRVGRSSIRVDQLEVKGDCEGRLIVPAGQTDTVRVEIDKIGSGNRSEIQLSLAHRPLEAGKRYAVSFRGRADRPRRFSFGIQLAQEPWTTIGLYRDEELTPSWRQFYFEFIATETTERARVLFDLGARDISAELAEVTLKDGIEEFAQADIPQLRRLLRILEARAEW